MKTVEKIELLLAYINNIVEKIVVNCAWLMLFAITLLNIVQVFFRYVLNNALSWSEEASLWMMVWISFIIIPVAYRKGLNISMMLFRDMLGRNRMEYIIRCLFHLIVILIAVICLYQSWIMFTAGRRIELPALEISKAWVYAIMPPAWILLMLAAVEKFFADVTGIIDPRRVRQAEDRNSSQPGSEEVRV
ncbi:MAG: TRAP transporter small permease [Desulfofustis sp. PB-SRB1]|jgi:TRAP-type C4-dicarboxylate transport system permease small subunit|nr:TRAP transporter small permease [Desulfofustis sp. PB-SRB1]MBM1002648.1 TRAP transporter small permease [Desulfofustis sp. PB-SRB1]HBH27989.1 TRAP transporter small permease [Desulfofustis sp.]HBH32791.1 TRAP transporter small permease [Desulfofustis sp.]